MGDTFALDRTQGESALARALIVGAGYVDLENGRARSNHSRLHPATTQSDDHEAHYPTAHPITIHLTGDTSTGRRLGAQWSAVSSGGPGPAIH